MPCFLSSLFTTLFLFCSITRSFSSYPLHGFFLPLLRATSLLFILLDSMGFLPFVPKASPTFFFLGTFLQDYPLTHWLPDHYLHLECVCYTTPHSRTKLLILFLPFLLSILLEWIRIRVSLFTYSYGMHRVVQALCLPLLGELPSQQGIFPKEGLTRISK